MKQSLLILGTVATLCSACTSENRNTTTDTTNTMAADTDLSSVASETRDRQECYRFVKNRDTVSMKLQVKGEEYSGELSYNLFEKDKNKGFFGGEMKGDTLITEYTFDAEGMRSVREAVFLKRNGKFYEGFGDTIEKEGKTHFKDRSKLNFNDTIALDKVVCD